MAFLCHDRERMSNSLTAVLCEIANTDELLRLSEERLNLSLGAGLARLKGQVFRIGHLGALGSGVAAAQKWFQQDGW